MFPFSERLRSETQGQGPLAALAAVTARVTARVV